MAGQKPAIQPTTYLDKYAWKAVDGNTSFGGHSCNLSELHSWWALDLVYRFLVSKLIVMTDWNGAVGNLRFHSCRVSWSFELCVNFRIKLENVAMAMHCSLNAAGRFCTVLFLEMRGPNTPSLAKT